MAQALFTDAARADVDDAIGWYESKAPEMVSEFCDALRYTVQRIEQNPKQFPRAASKTRRALLRRFPYLVLFRETRDFVVVVAVFHTSLDPRIWRSRNA
jgi:plasmid stabilization system protein ParE